MFLPDLDDADEVLGVGAAWLEVQQRLHVTQRAFVVSAGIAQQAAVIPGLIEVGRELQQGVVVSAGILVAVQLAGGGAHGAGPA